MEIVLSKNERVAGKAEGKEEHVEQFKVNSDVNGEESYFEHQQPESEFGFTEFIKTKKDTQKYNLSDIPTNVLTEICQLLVKRSEDLVHLALKDVLSLRAVSRSLYESVNSSHIFLRLHFATFPSWKRFPKFHKLRNFLRIIRDDTNWKFDEVNLDLRTYDKSEKSAKLLASFFKEFSIIIQPTIRRFKLNLFEKYMPSVITLLSALNLCILNDDTDYYLDTKLIESGDFIKTFLEPERVTRLDLQNCPNGRSLVEVMETFISITELRAKNLDLMRLVIRKDFTREDMLAVRSGEIASQDERVDYTNLKPFLSVTKLYLADLQDEFYRHIDANKIAKVIKALFPNLVHLGIKKLQGNDFGGREDFEVTSIPNWLSTSCEVVSTDHSNMGLFAPCTHLKYMEITSNSPVDELLPFSLLLKFEFSLHVLSMQASQSRDPLVAACIALQKLIQLLQYQSELQVVRINSGVSMQSDKQLEREFVEKSERILRSVQPFLKSHMVKVAIIEDLVVILKPSLDMETRDLIRHLDEKHDFGIMTLSENRSSELKLKPADYTLQ